MNILTINDLIDNFDYDENFSHFSETDQNVTIFLHKMPPEILNSISSVPSKVEGKNIFFHFATSDDTKYKTSFKQDHESYDDFDDFM